MVLLSPEDPHPRLGKVRPQKAFRCRRRSARVGVGPGGVSSCDPGVWGAPRFTLFTLPGPPGPGRRCLRNPSQTGACPSPPPGPHPRADDPVTAGGLSSRLGTARPQKAFHRRWRSAWIGAGCPHVAPGCGEPHALPNSLVRVLRVEVGEVRENPSDWCPPESVSQPSPSVFESVSPSSGGGWSRRCWRTPLSASRKTRCMNCWTE